MEELLKLLQEMGVTIPNIPPVTTPPVNQSGPQAPSTATGAPVVPAAGATSTPAQSEAGTTCPMPRKYREFRTPNAQRVMCL